MRDPVLRSVVVHLFLNRGEFSGKSILIAAVGGHGEFEWG